MRSLGIVIALAVVVGAEPAPSPAQIADQVAAAFAEGNTERIANLAKTKDVDPWLVAGTLVAHESSDAAAAYATAAAQPKLTRYVASRRNARSRRKDLLSVRDALRTAAGGDSAAALAILDKVDDAEEDVVSVMVKFHRGRILRDLGKDEKALDSLHRGGNLAESLGWDRSAELAWRAMAGIGVRARDWGTAQHAYVRLLRQCPGDGLAGLAVCALELDDVKQAYELATKALRESEKSKIPSGISKAFEVLGLASLRLGELKSSADYFTRGVAFGRSAKRNDWTAAALTHLAEVQRQRGDLAQARGSSMEAIRLQRSVNNAGGLVQAMLTLASVQAGAGRFAAAADIYREVSGLAILRARVDLQARLEAGLGALYASRGEAAKALRHHERATSLYRRAGSRFLAAQHLIALASGYRAVGAVPRAITTLEQALKEYNAMKLEADRSAILNNLGELHYQLGRLDPAESYLRKALETAERNALPGPASHALNNLAAVSYSRKNYPQSIAYLKRALVYARALRNDELVVNQISNIGELYLVQGKLDEALKYRKRALAASADLDSITTVAYIHWGLADIYLARNEPDAAIDSAEKGVALLPQLVGQLDEQQAAAARGRWAGMIDVGLRSAVRAGNADRVSFFQETGRAGALLESLGNRKDLRDHAIPPRLRKEERAAQDTLRRHRADLARARKTRKRKAIRDARRRVKEASDAYLSVLAKIQRSARAAADVLYPKATPLAEIQATLGAGDALVQYALLADEAHALVVTKSASRVVALGKSAAILRAQRSLILAKPESDTAPAAAALYLLVIRPLALEDEIRRVLVAPHVALTYVPFSLLLPGRDVAYVPSGSTHTLLHASRARRGDGVLALGDPAYRKLNRLPGSRAEAKAIGDVTLLGDEATKDQLVASLGKRKRWSAVHLACHGIVNPDRPLLSSLALATGGADEDGFLRTHEIFQLSVPSDLVVLSACETGKGKIYASEGLIGFTRAFLFAGTPRVVVSLWKVDDEATRALMTRFYELWRTGKHTTASALRRAQEHVRGQEKWRHPYYWAAWQLWGVAD